MSSEVVGTAGSSQPVECWCCGQTRTESAVVRLGRHPEVALCLSCAHFVHRRARTCEDVGVRSPGATGRGVLRAATAGVVRRDWHRKPVVGPALRWFGSRRP